MFDKRVVKKQGFLPVMGLIFASSARSLDASSHSLLIVLGGGGAAIETYETLILLDV
jgi:hypothetical protein